MIALMAAPTLVAIFSTPEGKSIAIVDETHLLANKLHGGDEMNFVVCKESFDEAMNNEDYDGILLIGKDAISKPSDITLYTRGAGSMQLEEIISSQLEDAIEAERIKAYNIDNLSEILEEIDADVKLSTYRIDKEETSATSSLVSYAIGMVTSFLLYMFIILYGQMVMTSIIEEKNNRVLELVVSSVKPVDLMIGKICGIGLVALTQVLIWAVLLCSFSAFVMPSLLASAVSDLDGSMVAAITQLGSVGYVMSIFGYLIVFLLGGYLLYASMFAAIGSAVDNIQDASQLQSFAVVPILIGLVCSVSVVSDPNSTVAVWTSIIPLTSPMVMMARIPFGVAPLEIASSVVLLAVCIAFMIWLSAKIYRVGIFMYGKKPNITDLIRWARYK
jgi:ABC-2 type transport system permease protein